MTNALYAIVVGARGDEFAHVKQCLSDWHCLSTPLTDEQPAPFSQVPSLIIVYARKDQKKTLTACAHLRTSPQSSAAPLLLVIGRYELPQGNAVKRLGNATFIMTPFTENGLRDKLKKLLSGLTS